MQARPLALVCATLAAALAGCSRNPTGMTNPFATADRVPAPATRLAPGTAQPYYPATPGGPPTTFAQPGLQPQTALPQTAPPFSGGVAPSFQTQPLNHPAPFNSAAPPPASTPFGAASRPSQPLASSTPGDSVAIPGDSTALRFGAPAKPAPLNLREPASLASRTVGSNGWISGSAPVRSPVDSGGSMLATAPRVRVPTGGSLQREPVDVAALDQPRTSTNSGDGTIGWR